MQDTLSVYDNLVIGHMQIEEMRSLASRKTGLPVGIFRLVTQGGKEMYDGHLLEDYGVDVGHTIFLENLDGWNEFLNLAVMGFTPQVGWSVGWLVGWLTLASLLILLGLRPFF